MAALNGAAAATIASDRARSPATTLTRTAPGWVVRSVARAKSVIRAIAEVLSDLHGRMARSGHDGAAGYGCLVLDVPSETPATDRDRR